MNKLKFEEYVYTTGTDINAAEQEPEVAKKWFRDTKFKVSQQEEDEVLNVSATSSSVDTRNTKNSSKFIFFDWEGKNQKS